MAIQKGLYIHGGSGTPNYDAVNDRVLISALLGAGPFDVVTAGVGARGRGHGILQNDALAVTSTGASDKGVRIAAGICSIRGTGASQYGSYLCQNDAQVTLTLADRPTATNTRWDLIIARVNDAQFAGALNSWTLEVVAGTPSTTPVDPVVPASSLVLARIVIPPGANPFNTTGMITDLRPHARASGGITPVANEAAAAPNPQDFDFIYDYGASRLKMRLEGIWATVGHDLDANWTTFTPSWGGMVLGTGSIRYGRYVRLGRTIIGIAGVILGTSGASVSGPINMSLSGSGLPACVDEGGIEYLAGGRAHDASPNRFYSCAADVDPVAGAINNFGTAGAVSWRTGIPIAWANTDELRIFFQYQTAT